jgi:hypothetical protein
MPTWKTGAEHNTHTKCQATYRADQGRQAKQVGRSASRESIACTTPCLYFDSVIHQQLASREVHCTMSHNGKQTQ